MINMCDYEFNSGKKCKEKSLKNAKYCILHVKYPQRKNREQFDKICNLKKQKVQRKISAGDYNFEGCIIEEIKIIREIIGKHITFDNAKIKILTIKRSSLEKDISFEGANINNLIFNDSVIRGDIILDNAKNITQIKFMNVTVRGDVVFDNVGKITNIEFLNVTVRGDVLAINLKNGTEHLFETVTVEGDFLFDGANIDKIRFDDVRVRGTLSFESATINKLNLSWITLECELLFRDAKIGNLRLQKSTIQGEMTLKEMKKLGKIYYKENSVAFLTIDIEMVENKAGNLTSMENLYKDARITLEKLGRSSLADSFYYKEMETKRKQKNVLIRLLELPVQSLFGYGTYWRRVLMSWFVVVFGAGILYWLGSGVECGDSLWECIYFSILTATTLSYGDYRPAPGIYQGIATLEAIFGTFIWAAFIAIFARKYMRR